MINNIEHIKDLLEFETEDDFYYLQVLKRKKENPGLGRNSYLVKSYQITSTEYLDLKMPEIINLCDFHTARAYINLNRRSFRKIADEVLIKYANQMKNRDYYSVRKLYDSVCGLPGGMNQKKRRWVVDIDNFDEEYDQRVQSFINNLDPTIGNKILVNLPTLNGHHLITSPFRLDLFKKEFPELDIQKNNPTILYVS